MNDLEFLEELADQIADVGVSRDPRRAARLREAVANLTKPDTATRGQVEVARAEAKLAREAANRSQTRAIKAVQKARSLGERLAIYQRTGEFPETQSVVR